MKLLSLLFLAAALTACATKTDTWKESNQFDETGNLVGETAAVERRFQPADPDFYRRAYEQGVRDTLNEYKGRMRAREHYVWEPPMVQRVKVPGRIIGGTFYPEHEEEVIIRPGRFVLENGLPAPEVPQPSAAAPQ